MKTRLIRRTSDSRLPRSAEDEARLDAVFARPESEIDLTDIPEWTAEEFKIAARREFYRPTKGQITAKIDNDVLSWLKSDGRGYQSRMNAILRREMLRALTKGDAA
jgi:uncharacterized protein (DUF4415 family)